MPYCVTVALVGHIYVDTDDSDEAVEIANSHPEDIKWSKNYTVTNCVGSD